MKDIKIKLSALWGARMLTGLQGDVLRFLSPEFIQEILDEETDVAITDELLLIVAILFTFPIMMTFLSLTLEDKLNRRVNLALGIFFALFDLGFLIMIITSGDKAFEIYYGFVYLIFTFLVAWYAWNWRTTN